MQQNRWNIRKTVFLAVLSVSLMVSMIYWFIKLGSTLDMKGFLMMGIQFVVVGFAIILAFKRLRSVKQQLPAEDEMSKNILRRGAATSYYVSLYMWLVLMFFGDRINLEKNSLIGAGILGMAIIYAISWVYHMYIKRSHD